MPFIFFREIFIPYYEEGVMVAHRYAEVIGSNPILYFFVPYNRKQKKLSGFIHILGGANMAKRSDYNKFRREALGLTQAQLGVLAGVSAGSVSSFENDLEVGEPTCRAIINALSREFGKLDPVQKTEAYIQVSAKCLTLGYLNPVEKIKVAGSLAKNSGELIRLICKD